MAFTSVLQWGGLPDGQNDDGSLNHQQDERNVPVRHKEDAH